MSMKECIDSYSFRVCEQETMFRDLFGLEELKKQEQNIMQNIMERKHTLNI